jgi:hypothetical protein
VRCAAVGNRWQEKAVPGRVPLIGGMIFGRMVMPQELPDLARISHQLSAAARDKAASTSLRLLTVLNILSKYASAR